MAKILSDIEAGMDAVARVCGDVCRHDTPNATAVPEGAVPVSEAGFAPLQKKDINCRGLYENLDLIDRPPHPVSRTERPMMDSIIQRLDFSGPCEAAFLERPVGQDEAPPNVRGQGEAYQLLHPP